MLRPVVWQRPCLFPCPVSLWKVLSWTFVLEVLQSARENHQARACTPLPCNTADSTNGIGFFTTGGSPWGLHWASIFYQQKPTPRLQHHLVGWPWSWPSLAQAPHLLPRVCPCQSAPTRRHHVTKQFEKQSHKELRPDDKYLDFIIYQIYTNFPVA